MAASIAIIVTTAAAAVTTTAITAISVIAAAAATVEDRDLYRVIPVHCLGVAQAHAIRCRGNNE